MGVNSTHRVGSKRTLFALFVAPLAASIAVSSTCWIGLSLYAILFLQRPRPDEVFAPDILTTLLLVTAAPSVVLTTFIGGVIHQKLMRSTRRDLGTYLLLGLTVAMVICFPIAAALQALEPRSQWFFFMAIVALPTAALTILLFWLIRRPDRDAPNPPTSPS